MSQSPNDETLASIGAQNQAQGQQQQPQQQQLQIQVDDSGVQPIYAKTANVMGSAEELFIDFCGPLRQTGPKTAAMKVYSRIAITPWTAKRLALMLQQTIRGYEETYGHIELDESKRRVISTAGLGRTNI
jgi:hypothetical protein